MREAAKGSILLATVLLAAALSATSTALSLTVAQAARELRLREDVMCARMATLRAALHRPGPDMLGTEKAAVEISSSVSPGGQALFAVTVRCKSAERSVTVPSPI